MARITPPLPMNQFLAQLQREIRIATSAYTVSVTNRTVDTIFDRFVCFYNRVGQSGVVFLEQLIVIPNETRVFNLGPCGEMQSYVIGFFVDDDLVAKIPLSGNMTPALASMVSPGDVSPCEDSWAIFD